MKTPSISLFLPIFTLTALFALTGYNCNDILDDPGFDLWCGDTLCSWTLERGQLERVPTWHTSDSGVSMVGDDVAFSQLAETSVSCVRFELIADVADSAEVTLQVDVDDDGEIEHQERIPTSSWQELSYLIRLPPAQRGILFRLHKRGAGRAVLAEVAALSENPAECAALPFIERENGALCTVDDECQSHRCVADGILDGRTCGACSYHGECDTDEVCGLTAPGSPHLRPYRTCVVQGSRGLGERCRVDGECATGMCENDVCSTCVDDGDCHPGRRCEPRVDSQFPEWTLRPLQCDAASGSALAGAVCLTGDDCQSGQCTGTGDLRLCLSDSRACTADSDCPGSVLGISGAWDVCATVGTAHGVCE